MLIVISACDEYVIEVGADVWNTTEDAIHDALEYGMCRIQSERESIVLVQTLRSVDYLESSSSCT